MKRLRWGLLFLLLALGAHAGKLLLDAGVLRRIEPRGFETCRNLAEIRGAEDLAYAAGLGQIFISSDERPEHAGEETPSGAIYALRPGGRAAPERVTENLPFAFHPHGIAVWEGSGGPRLFVINHRAEEDTIEIFSWAGKLLKHEETLRDPALQTANDLVALGPRSFYVSQDHGGRSHLSQQLEHFTRLGRGSLDYFDGARFRRLVGGISFANGLALDSKRQLLYVAAMLERAVRVYRIVAPEQLSLSHVIELSGGPDNLQLAPDGKLWIAAHPKILALRAHAEHHAQAAPTEIWRVSKPYRPEATAVSEMVDDGTRISAASVALPLGGQLYLGSIYDLKLLACEEPGAHPSPPAPPPPGG